MPDMKDRSNRKVLFYILVILLASIGVYLNALQNGFVYDDFIQVLKNPWIRDTKYLPRIFSTGAWGYFGMGTNYYRPMMHVMYMLAYNIFGLNPVGFHLINVLFHAGVSVLVFLVALRLISKPLAAGPEAALTASFASAIIFAVHPVHTEAVTWVAGLPDLSSTFFYLLSFYLYMRSQEDGEAPRGAYYLLSLASFLVSALCKEPALTLPVVLIAYDRAFGGHRPMKPGLLMRYTPYLAVALVYFVIRYTALGGLAPNMTKAGYSLYQCVINALPLFCGYILKAVLPAALSNFHSFHPLGSIFSLTGVISLAVTAAFASAMYIAFRKSRVVFFGMLLFALPLLPALYIPAVGKSAFAERYLYLPSFGFVLILSYAVIRAGSKGGKLSMAAAAAMSLAILFYSIGTIDRNKVWKDNYTLWSDSVKKSPGSPETHDGLGCALYYRGQTDEAVDEFRKAISLEYTYPEAHGNLGNAYNVKGEIYRAIEEYKAAIVLGPRNAAYHSNLGVAYGKSGQLDKAVTEFESALRLNPYYADACNNLGLAYKKMGLTGKAAPQFEMAVSLDPENETYRNNLANLQRHTGG